MQNWKGRAYRGPYRRGAAGGSVRGLSSPNPTPSTPEPFTLPEYDKPPKAANKNRRYENFKRPQQRMPKPFSPKGWPNKPRPGGVPGRMPIPRPGMSAAPLAGLALARFWWPLFIAAGVAWVTYEAWRAWTGRSHWAMHMRGYTYLTDCPSCPTLGEPEVFLANGATCCASILKSSAVGWFPTEPGLIEGVVTHPSLPNRWATTEQWNRLSARRAPYWLPDPLVDPWEPLPSEDPEARPARPNPNVVPWAVPPGVPWPEPSPIPWRAVPHVRPNPYVSPEVQPQRGPDGRPNPVAPWPQPQPQPSPVDPLPVPQPQPLPSPSTPPQVSPPVQVFPPVRPGVGRPGSNVGRPRPTHRRARPGRKTRERKGYAAGGGPLIMWALNAATESYDLLEAFWWALPRQFRSPPQWVNDHWAKPTPQTMAADLWKNWQEIDIHKAAHNVVMNEIGDFVAGTMGRSARNAVRQLADQGLWVSPGGLATGPAL